MISLKFVAICIAAVVAGLTAVGNAMWGPRARARRRLERGRRTTIADREIVTLSGKVRARETIASPLSGRECVAYEAIGNLRQQAFGHAGVETERLVELDMTTFELVTDEGVVIVEGEVADIALAPIPIIPRKLAKEQEFLERHARSAHLASSSGFEEVLVENGAKIAVQGMAVVEQANESNAERGYRDAPTRIRIIGHVDHPLTIGRPR
jgi:hypothetical protein